MKGMVFRELLELVEERFGADTVDDIIDAAELASGGAYTTVGTYHHGEMVRLVMALAEHTRLAARELLFAFAEHLIGRFRTLHPRFFAGAENSSSFLERVDAHVHLEV